MPRARLAIDPLTATLSLVQRRLSSLAADIRLAAHPDRIVLERTRLIDRRAFWSVFERLGVWVSTGGDGEGSSGGECG